MARKLSLARRSEQLYGKASRLIPGGVNSPVRKYSPYPLFVASGKGAKFKTVDGNELLDYCMGYGALLDGHAPRHIIRTVKASAEKGMVYGQPTEKEVELAGLIIELIPSIEMVRLASTGAEATMHAVRLARGFTERKKILKFEGCYHGAHDNLLVKRGRHGVATGSPGSAGILHETARNTLVSKYNDLDFTSKVIDDYGDELAGVIVEPVMGNMGPVLPEPGFLESLRKQTREKGALLIFDEVITGFRMAPGGAQEYYRVTPDITTLGKILGGGLPLAALGGKREVMEKLVPTGPVYQAGTFSGNPLSVAAGVAMLNSIKARQPRLYTRLEEKGQKLRNGIKEIVTDRNVSAQVNGIGSMFQVFFTSRQVRDYDSARSSNIEMYDRYFHSLLKSDVFVPPSQFETCFLSTVHSDNDLSETLTVIDSALKATS